MTNPNPTHVASITTPQGLLVLIDTESHTILRDHINFDRIVAALRDKTYAELPELFNTERSVQRAVEEFSVGENEPNFTFTNRILHYRGKPLPPELSEKIVRMVQEGSPLTPLLRFVEKLWRNPRRTARYEGLLFFVANQMMIHEDGDFIAYRKVSLDYMDFYTGTVFQKPAMMLTEEERARFPYTTDRKDAVTGLIENGLTIIEMDPAEVDEDRNRTCSQGLHFADYSYAETSYHGGSGRLLVVKINPADVVAIPSDYRNKKGRCYRYAVLSEVKVIGEQTRPQPLARREVYSYEHVGSVDPNRAAIQRRVIDLLLEEFITNWTRDEIKDVHHIVEDFHLSGEDRLRLTDRLENVLEIDGQSITLGEVSGTLGDLVTALMEILPDDDEQWDEDDGFDEDDDYEEDIEDDEEEDEGAVLAFTEGDRVRIRGTTSYRSGEYGEVADTDRFDTDYPYYVRFEDGDTAGYAESDVEDASQDIVEWRGHRFKDGKCLKCHGKRLSLESLGWECQPDWQVVQ